VAAEWPGLTEAVRIVARVTSEMQVSAGGVYGLGCHVVWGVKYRRPVIAGRCKGLIRAKADEHGWRIMALEIMPDHVHLLVEAHTSDCPSWVADQVKGLSWRRLRAEFPRLWCQLPVLWSWPYFAAMVGAVSVETTRRCRCTQDGRSWGKERPR
jgi:putative transposase